MIRNYLARCGDWLTNRAAPRLRRLYPLGDNSCTSLIFSTLDSAPRRPFRPAAII